MGRYTPQTPCAPRAARHPLRVCPAPRSLNTPHRKEVPTIDFCHIPVSIIKRSEGRSAVAAAAYRSGTKLTNEWDGLTHDYTRKSGVVHGGGGGKIMLPAHAPPEFADRSTLWNSVEQIEKARDSQLAREIEAALPRELSREQQLALVRAYVKDNFVDKGMCADFAIHDKGTGNPHVHIMLDCPALKRKRCMGREVPQGISSAGRPRACKTAICTTTPFANDNGQNPLMDKARAYVENWKEAYKNNTGLLLFGDVGTGKSFFAGCIANALLDRDVPVLMTNFPTILNRLTGMFSEDRADFIASFDEYDLLIIDDLGVERSTEYAMEQMFFVIDSRYRSRRPMIITTNLKLAELKNPPDLAHARIYDRILERCAPILFAGKNFREENAGATRQAAKDLVNRKHE